MTEKIMTKDIISNVVNSDINTAEWKSLENIIKTKILPLCDSKGCDYNIIMRDYLEHYSMLNYNYNRANKKYLSSDIIHPEIYLKHQDLALDYMLNFLDGK
ncbi:MAG: hypothetical protein ACP5N1_02505 [Candidatus Woesearchaeota archaeon]